PRACVDDHPLVGPAGLEPPGVEGPGDHGPEQGPGLGAGDEGATPAPGTAAGLVEAAGPVEGPVDVGLDRHGDAGSGHVAYRASMKVAWSPRRVARSDTPKAKVATIVSEMAAPMENGTR